MPNVQFIALFHTRNGLARTIYQQKNTMNATWRPQTKDAGHVIIVCAHLWGGSWHSACLWLAESDHVTWILVCDWLVTLRVSLLRWDDDHDWDSWDTAHGETNETGQLISSFSNSDYREITSHKYLCRSNLPQPLALNPQSPCLDQASREKTLLSDTRCTITTITVGSSERSLRGHAPIVLPGQAWARPGKFAYCDFITVLNISQGSHLSLSSATNQDANDDAERTSNWTKIHITQNLKGRLPNKYWHSIHLSLDWIDFGIVRS